MDDVPVVEIGHEDNAHEGEDEDEKLLVVGRPLLWVEKRPDHMVNLQYDEKRDMRRAQVQYEAFLMGGCKEKKSKNESKSGKSIKDAK